MSEAELVTTWGKIEAVYVVVPRSISEKIY